MRILTLPYFAGNPYQECLFEALRELGAQVLPKANYGIGEFFLDRLRSRNPDIIHLHWTHPFLLRDSLVESVLRGGWFLLQVAVLRLLGVRFVWTVHNLTAHESAHRRFELLCHRILCALCHRLIVHSEFARTAIANSFSVAERRKIRVIPHGHYIGCYPMDLPRKEARRRLGLGTDHFVFLYFGLIREYKGLNELIEAFSRLESERAVLLIAGRPLTQEIADGVLALAENHKRIVLSLQFIDNDQVQVFFKAADVVVLPFKAVFSSGSLLLAMSFGKPIIAPAIPSLREVLVEEGALSYEASEKGALSRCLRESMECDLATMGVRNREAAQQYDWARIGAMTSDVFAETLTSSRGRHHV